MADSRIGPRVETTGSRLAAVTGGAPFSIFASGLGDSGFGSCRTTEGGITPPEKLPLAEARLRYSSRVMGCSAIQSFRRKTSVCASASENGVLALSATSARLRWPSKASSSFHCGACRRMEGASRS